jgi:TfoX/Sxy family transcriptional regulator of competence genes
MSTSQTTIDHMLDDLSELPLSARKMFGEYALYLDGKVVALVCDDTLFIKPTKGSLAQFTHPLLAPPYPGAKNYIDATSQLDDVDLVVAALRVAAADLPPPKPKTARKAK